MLAILGLLALSPVLAFLSALLRGAVLFWPVMVFLGSLHTYWDVVPALPWWGTFLLVMVLGLLIPSGSTVDLDK